MKVIEAVQTVRTIDSVIVEDEDNDILWFIFITRQDGKFVKFEEGLNPHLFNKQDPNYRNKVVTLAYNAVSERKK